MRPLHPRLFDIEALLQDGFGVDEITSDTRGVHVRLARAPMTLTVRITRQEAEEILFGTSPYGDLGHPLLRP